MQNRDFYYYPKETQDFEPIPLDIEANLITAIKHHKFTDFLFNLYTPIAIGSNVTYRSSLTNENPISQILMETAIEYENNIVIQFLMSANINIYVGEKALTVFVKKQNELIFSLYLVEAFPLELKSLLIDATHSTQDTLSIFKSGIHNLLGGPIRVETVDPEEILNCAALIFHADSPEFNELKTFIDSINAKYYQTKIRELLNVALDENKLDDFRKVLFYYDKYLSIYNCLFIDKIFFDAVRAGKMNFAVVLLTTSSSQELISRKSINDAAANVIKFFHQQLIEFTLCSYTFPQDIFNGIAAGWVALFNSDIIDLLLVIVLNKLLAQRGKQTKDDYKNLNRLIVFSQLINKEAEFQETFLNACRQSIVSLVSESSTNLRKIRLVENFLGVLSKETIEFKVNCSSLLCEGKIQHFSQEILQNDSVLNVDSLMSLNVYLVILKNSGLQRHLAEDIHRSCLAQHDYLLKFQNKMVEKVASIIKEKMRTSSSASQSHSVFQGTHTQATSGILLTPILSELYRAQHGTRELPPLDGIWQVQYVMNLLCAKHNELRGKGEIKCAEMLRELAYDIKRALRGVFAKPISEYSYDGVLTKLDFVNGISLEQHNNFLVCSPLEPMIAIDTFLKLTRYGSLARLEDYQAKLEANDCVVISKKRV